MFSPTSRFSPLFTRNNLSIVSGNYPLTGRIRWHVAILRTTPEPADRPKPHHGVQQFLRKLGPGLITGAADDDPLGISTYSGAGASYGYATLWTALLSFPLMAAIQLMCARLGMITGRSNSRWAVSVSSARTGIIAKRAPWLKHYRLRGSKVAMSCT
jgi:hypothetical protein